MSRIRKTALDNDINVITEEMADVESATVGVWVKTGSRYELSRLGGISHFIEHLLFKGTENRSAHDIAKEIESVGGVLNAFTGREYTCFYAKVLAKDLSRAFDILSDIFINSVFDPDELERERLVILQEIKMVEDTPDDLIHDLFAETIWGKHPMGASVLGTRKSVGGIKREQIKRYMGRHYASRMVFITAAGKVKHAQVVRELSRTFGRIKRGGAKVKSAKPVPVARTKLFKRDLEQVHLCLGAPAPRQGHPDRYRVYLMNTVLGGGMSSRLFQEIREKRGLAYSVYSYLNLSTDSGALTVYAGTSGEHFREVLELILKEFDAIKTVTDVELDNAKDHLKGSMMLGLETSESRMMKMAKDEIYYGRPVKIKEIADGIDSVTAGDIKSIAGKVLKNGGLALAAIGKVAKSAVPAELKNY